MAESFLVRRGSLSSGNISLNIWNGSSPPENSVGVFGQTTETVSQIYVVPEGLASEGTWTLGYQNVPVTSGQCNTPTVNGNIVYLQYASNKNVYAYDTTNDVYSLLTINTQSTLIVLGSLRFVNGIIYSFVTQSSGTQNTGDMRCNKYDIDSQIWSASSIYMGDMSGINGTAYFNGKIYVDTGYGSYCQDYVWTYSIESDTLSMLGKYGVYNRWSAWVACQYDERYLYSYGGYATGSVTQLAVRWDLSMGNLISFDLPYNVNQAFNPIRAGTILGDVMWGFCPGLTRPIVLDIGVNSWHKDSQDSPSRIQDGFQLSQAIAVGNDMWVFGCIGGLVMRYSATGDIGTFPAGSLVVECGKTENDAEIVSGEETKATISVKNVYYSDGNTLSVIPGKVRVTGGSWTDIVS